ncbi:MAG: hypothetical protein Q9181_003500 [Wetmoreana brouardii]
MDDMDLNQASRRSSNFTERPVAPFAAAPEPKYHPPRTSDAQPNKNIHVGGVGFHRKIEVWYRGTHTQVNNAVTCGTTSGDESIRTCYNMMISKTRECNE